MLQYDFECCGIKFIVKGKPGVYHCRKCNKPIYFKTDPRTQTRLSQVRTKTAKQKKLIRAIKRLSPNEKYGDAVSRFEILATKYKSKSASVLQLILFNCGCTRDIAVQELNKQGWPEWTDKPHSPE